MQVLIVGLTATPEFADVVSLLRTQVSSEEIRTCRSVEEVSTSSTAELLVVLQQWPDEFTSSEVLTLINRHPLSRLIVCYGPWCESDGRTRDVWPHAVRVALTEAPDRLRQEIEHIRRGHPPLPLTATREETFEHHLSVDLHGNTSPKRIGMLSADTAFLDWMQNVLQDAGHTANASILSQTDVVVWDADPWTPNGRERLATVLPLCVGKPLIAMCGFPRRHEVRELLDTGVTLVLPKVLSPAQLLEHIEAVICPPQADESGLSGHLRVHQTG